MPEQACSEGNRIYAGLTMKTICSLLVTLFAIVLIASATPQNNLASTLSISCPTGDYAGTIQFDFANRF
jgi:hypothetical protein